LCVGGALATLSACGKILARRGRKRGRDASRDVCDGRMQHLACERGACSARDCGQRRARRWKGRITGPFSRAFAGGLGRHGPGQWSDSKIVLLRPLNPSGGECANRRVDGTLVPRRSSAAALRWRNPCPPPSASGPPAPTSPPSGAGNPCPPPSTGGPPAPISPPSGGHGGPPPPSSGGGNPCPAPSGSASAPARPPSGGRVQGAPSPVA